HVTPMPCGANPFTAGDPGPRVASPAAKPSPSPPATARGGLWRRSFPRRGGMAPGRQGVSARRDGCHAER
ncbi:hypothetical protein, partial [Haematobacter sp. UBA3484]|uniref:hypothetical protein n=1 Tax=Haematobacter sp. UBA3484 TaxID=1946582 RepID=UPI0025C32AA8